MMGLFKRKDSKGHPNSDASKSHKPQLLQRVSADRLTEFSLQSPRLLNTNPIRSQAAMTVPDIPIPGPPDPASDPAAYLRSIYAVRQRTRFILQKAKSDSLNHFDVDLSKFQDTADYVVSIIKVRIPTPFAVKWSEYSFDICDFPSTITCNHPEIH
jgi:hypothetical protein